MYTRSPTAIPRLRSSALMGLAGLAMLLIACGGDSSDPIADSGADTTAVSSASGEPEASVGNAAEADEQTSSTTAATSTSDQTQSSTDTDTDTDTEQDADTGQTTEQDQVQDQNDPDEQTASPEIAELQAALVAISEEDGIMVDESAGRCVAEQLHPVLSPEGYQALTEAISEDRSLSDDDPLDDDDVEAIGQSLAQCLDLSPLTSEIEADSDFEGYDQLLSCVRSEVGEDGIEAALMEEVLNDSRDTGSLPLFEVGLERCPDEAQLVLADLVATEFSSDDYSATRECLLALPPDALLPLTDGSLGSRPVYQDFISQNCS